MKLLVDVPKIVLLAQTYREERDGAALRRVGLDPDGDSDEPGQDSDGDD